MHETANVEPGAVVGKDTRIWHGAHVRAGAIIGKACVIGGLTYIDRGVVIGDRVKLENLCLVYQGVTLEDGVFVGPAVTFTNDVYPRSVNPDETLKSRADWQVTPTLIEKGASLCARSTVLCGITIGT